MRTDPSERTIRLLFAKTGKTLSSLQFKTAEQELLITKQTQIVSDLRVSKRRRVAIDANDKFADIESIIAVQEEAERRKMQWEHQDRLKEAREQAELLVQKGMQPFLHEFHVVDLVDAQFSDSNDEDDD